MRVFARILLVFLAAACGPKDDAREDAAGSADASFGTEGLAVVPRGATARGAVRDILELDDGSLLVGGNNAYVARFTSDGRLDESFANAGVDDTRRTAHTNQDVRRLARLADGSIAVVEVHSTPCRFPVFCGSFPHLFVRRINERGAPDVSYGMRGIEALGDVPGEIAVSPGGRVTALAFKRVPITTFFMVGSLDAEGVIDTGFQERALAAIQSCRRDEFYEITIESATLLADGERTLAAVTWAGWAFGEVGSVPFNELRGRGYCVVRLEADGRLDTRFGDGGRVLATLADPISVFRLLRGRDGELVLMLANAPTSFRRLSFGAAPATVDSQPLGRVGQDMALQRNGKVVVTGFGGVPSIGDSSYPWVSRAESTGELDNGFGTEGPGYSLARSGSTQMLPQRVIVDRSGRILVGGANFATGDGVVMRFR